MFQCVYEHIVVEHGFVITFLLLLHLGHEELLLHEGVVQLGVGIAELVVLDEEFESFSETGLAAVVFGKR